jgi:hypothetical protein
VQVAIYMAAGCDPSIGNLRTLMPIAATTPCEYVPNFKPGGH